MSVWNIQIKTHSREDITKDFLFIHDCIRHNKKPVVWHIVAGRRKENHWVVTCGDDECSKISMDSPEHVVLLWNHYNPTK